MNPKITMPSIISVVVIGRRMKSSEIPCHPFAPLESWAGLAFKLTFFIHDKSLPTHLPECIHLQYRQSHRPRLCPSCRATASLGVVRNRCRQPESNTASAPARRPARRQLPAPVLAVTQLRLPIPMRLAMYPSEQPS